MRAAGSGGFECPADAMCGEYYVADGNMQDMGIKSTG
jgi:hypothetical protein